jgi:hypothetical protein
MKKLTAGNSKVLNYFKGIMSKGQYSKLLAEVEDIETIEYLEDEKLTASLIYSMFIFKSSKIGEAYWFKVASDLIEKEGEAL